MRHLQWCEYRTPKIPHLPVELFMMLVPFCDQSASVHTILFVRSTVIFFFTYLYSNSVDTMPTIRVSLNQFSGLTGQGKKETLHVKFFLFNLRAYFIYLSLWVQLDLKLQPIKQCSDLKPQFSKVRVKPQFFKGQGQVNSR